MIPRYNIKDIKNRLEGNTKWLDYIPPVLIFDNSLSLGKYVLSVEDAWEWEGFGEFVTLYDALPGYQSFDEEYTGKTANVLELDDKERNLLSAFSDNLLVGWSDDGSTGLVDENGEEISSSDVIVDKSHIKMGESADGTLLASFGGQVFEVKEIDGELYAWKHAGTSIVSHKTPQDVIFVLPNYFYDSWDGGVFYSYYYTESDGWIGLDDVVWTPDMKFAYAVAGPELEVMENGYIDWEEPPDSITVEIEITEKNVDQWSDLIASMKKESEENIFSFSLEKSDDT